MEYDVRSVLEFYDGHGNMAVNGLLRWENMSLDDAVDSVRVCGGKVDPGYVDRMKRWLDEAGRLLISHSATGIDGLAIPVQLPDANDRISEFLVGFEDA